jgi:transcriptional regulator with XRE-family HTH domain
MNRDQRNKLYLEARDKGLTLTQLSKEVGYSISMLSKYFRHQLSLPAETESKLVQVIKEKKLFIMQLVEVEVE